MKKINQFLQTFFIWTKIYYGYQLVVSSSFLLFYAFFLYSFFILNDLSSIETFFFDKFLSIILFSTLVVFVEIIDFSLKNKKIQKIFNNIYYQLVFNICLKLLDFFNYENGKLNLLINNYLNNLLLNKHFFIDTIFTIEDQIIKQGKNIEYIEVRIFNNKLMYYMFVYKYLYLTLLKNEKFIESWGTSKVFISYAITETKEFALHNNIKFDNSLTMTKFLNKCKANMLHLTAENYFDEVINYIVVKVWNPYRLVNKKIIYDKKVSIRHFHSSTKINIKQNEFTPLKQKSKIYLLENKKKIITMDIETMTIKETLTNKGEKKREQTPVLISCAYFENGKIKSFYSLFDIKLFNNSELALEILWRDFFKKFKENIKFKHTIFTHNLGSFDGFYIYQALMKIYNVNNINAIIDKNNKFIQISLKEKDLKLTWKDSLRIFDVSLENLCLAFKTQGKLSKYKEEFNHFDLFNYPDNLKEFINYNLQDSISLLKSLTIAQNMYIEKHGVDFTSIWSTSTLSLKIFRQSFLNYTIPSLTSNLDSFIRKSYFGGATDHYKCFGNKLFAYDVNSLYPFVMKNPIPYKPLDFIGDMTKLKLEDFFGFCFAKITTPKNIKIPFLPYRDYDGRVIFPTGCWTGTYFSEELKEAVKMGYKIELISGFPFTKVKPFNIFVDHFYKLKKNASSPGERFIAKMILNQLYGYFGRSRELIITKCVKNIDIIKYLTTRFVKSIITINDLYSVILMTTNLNKELINDFNISLEGVDFKNLNKNVKSNVAISSAVTAYGRIEMMKYKTYCINNGIEIYYTDTDSLFTDKPLPPQMVGNELGQMKDILKGKQIIQALFLGNKRYIYQYPNNEEILNVTVFSGVKKNILTWNDFEKMERGEVITVKSPNTFTRSFKKLTITTSDREINIKKGDIKKNINNFYVPKKIYNLEKDYINQNSNIFKRVFIRVKNLINKYK